MPFGVESIRTPLAMAQPEKSEPLKKIFNMTYIIIMTTSIIAYLILRYGFGMDDPETFMKSMGFGVIAGIARLVYINHKREQEIEADAATESSTAKMNTGLNTKVSGCT